METGTQRSEAPLIEDGLWERFGTSASQQEFCASWLALQCRLVAGLAGGMVLLGAPDQDRPFRVAATWPPTRNPRDLADVAERALKERRGLVLKQELPDNGAARLRYAIAYPIEVAGQLRGVVALDADPRPEPQIRDAMRQIQWGSAWLEVLIRRGLSAGPSASSDRLQAVIALLATLVSHDGFRGAGVALATELATRLDCDRVSIGFLRRGRIRVEAVSHSAEFGEETNLLRAIAGAMSEALDQDQSVVFPEVSEKRISATRAHRELARQSGNGSLCSVLFRAQGEVVGVMTLERETGDFDPDTVETCEALAALAGPFLEVKRRDDRWIGGKALDAAETQLGHLIGSGHMTLKLIVIGALAVALFLTLARGDFRVTADTVIEPATRQAVVAAFDGYIRTAPLRAGDVVVEGEVLAELDDRDLQLERTRWQSQEDQSRRSYQEALGNADAAQVQILTAQIAQAEAQVELLNEQITRTRIAAPFDGVIVTGDLSQSLGAPVGRGDVLFEVAPLDSYRIILQVDERDVANVQVGQTGQLVLSGFADDPLTFSVARLTPVSTASEGRNFFRVEARLNEFPERLRPGMEGVGKIRIDRRRLIWIWTHEIVDWARMKTWNWLP